MTVLPLSNSQLLSSQEPSILTLQLNNQKTLDVKVAAKTGSPRRDNKGGSQDGQLTTKVRIYVPLEDTYTYFYLLRIDSLVTGEAVLSQVLQQMQLPFSLVAKSQSECSLIIDPKEYSIVLKVGPPVLTPGDQVVAKLLQKEVSQQRLR